MKPYSKLRRQLRITEVIQVGEHTEQHSAENADLVVQKRQSFKTDNILKEKKKNIKQHQVTLKMIQAEI